jgi:arsenite/tail-anchored protein-transporting ATPase
VRLVSTDPAHSLGDAWRQKFSNAPTRVPLDRDEGSLAVMEVDPQQSMQGELQQWAAVSQQLFGDHDNSSNNNNDDNHKDEWTTKMNQFQEWLSGIPGIDEATALSTAITHIESGKYDLIVFDTAPTGHTLKLLALPDILEQGIDKLQSWQTTFWGYWQAFKAASSGGVAQGKHRASLQNQVKDKLSKYKHDIQKVALMLQDQARTRFVVVCIAEFLSVSETQRLLQELDKNRVIASHVIVNQLVVQDSLTPSELAELESLAEVGTLQLPLELLQKTVHACRLTTARKAIQQRYLADLKGYPETQSMLNGICEVPLLAEEVTGAAAIQRFAQLLIHNPNIDATAGSSSSRAGKLYDDLIAAKNATTVTFAPGDTVHVVGLTKSLHFNDLEGKVTTHKNDDTGRYGVTVQYEGKAKTLALQPQNMVMVRKSDKKQKQNASSSSSSKDGARSGDTLPLTNGIMDKAKKVLEDPEIKNLIAQNPRFQAVVEECLDNPLNVMKYLGDPEMSPLVSKAMAKFGASY